MSKIKIVQKTETSTHKKTAMPIYKCECGTRILIVPDFHAMARAIKKHLSAHKELTGKSLSEETLTQEIIKVIANHR
jgi:hypothetical protein